MPTLTWELEDSKSCEGCILHSPDEHFMKDTCKIDHSPDDSFSYDRPQSCIEELGD
jgi:hypothetical protein